MEFLNASYHVPALEAAATLGRKSLDVQKPALPSSPAKTGYLVGFGIPKPRKIALAPSFRSDGTVTSLPNEQL